MRGGWACVGLGGGGPRGAVPPESCGAWWCFGHPRTCGIKDLKQPVPVNVAEVRKAGAGFRAVWLPHTPKLPLLSYRQCPCRGAAHALLLWSRIRLLTWLSKSTQPISRVPDSSLERGEAATKSKETLRLPNPGGAGACSLTRPPPLAFGEISKETFLTKSAEDRSLPTI